MFIDTDINKPFMNKQVFPLDFKLVAGVVNISDFISNQQQI